MCEYDTSRSPSPTGTPVTSSIISNEDHNYNAQNLHVIDSCEPPAFIIKQDDPHAILSPNNAHLNQQLLAMSQKLLAATGTSQQHKPIQPQQPGPLHQQHGPSHQQQHSSLHQQHGSLHYSYGSSDPGNTKRIRRSEVLLKQAADCVSRGQTFQTVSDQFNIPISTIRFFMARKGILPRRKRGRSSAALPVSPNDPRHLSSTGQSQSSATPPSPTQPPYHMATYKLPDFDLGRVS